jgi:hypothetical protein
MGAKEISDKYDKWKRENAAAKLALDVAPYTGQLTSAADVAQALYKGDLADAAQNALGFIPGLKLAHKFIPGSGTIKAVTKSTKNTPDNALRGVGKVLDVANDADNFRESTEAGYKRGGRVRSTGYKGYGKAKKV